MISSPLNVLLENIRENAFLYGTTGELFVTLIDYFGQVSGMTDEAGDVAIAMAYHLSNHAPSEDTQMFVWPVFYPVESHPKRPFSLSDFGRPARVLAFTTHVSWAIVSPGARLVPTCQ
jgi:hypothetical protein